MHSNVFSQNRKGVAAADGTGACDRDVQADGDFRGRPRHVRQTLVIIEKGVADGHLPIGRRIFDSICRRVSMSVM